MSEPEQIERRDPSYADHSGERMMERLAVNRGRDDPMTLEEVLRRLTDAGADHPDVVLVHQAFFSWERPATGDEHQHYLDLQENQRQRTEKWEREMYERLKEKYGDSDE
jgi:hypothetical protein